MGLRIALYHNLPSGGAKRTVFETVRRLAARHEIDEYCLSTSERAFCDVGPYVRTSFVFPFSAGRQYRRPFGRLNNAVRLVDLWRMQALGRHVAGCIDARGYDVVLVHPCTLVQAPTVLASLRTPSIYYCHEPPRGLYEPTIPRPYRPKPGYRGVLDRLDPLRKVHRSALGRTDRQNVLAASRVLVNSAYNREAVRRIYGVEAELNRPAVDTTLFQPLDLPREPFILSVGALQPEKGFDFLVESLGTMKPERRPRLVVVSNFEIPHERAYLSALAAERSVQVEFRLGISNSELVRRYNTAALTAYAPVREPLGLVPLESQACQTPVVGVAEGGVRETIVDGQTGVLVPRDRTAFAAALQGLLATPDVAARYGRQGRQNVEQRWSWDASVAALEAHLEAAARQRAPRSIPAPARRAQVATIER